MEIQQIAIEKLKPAKYNPRKIDPEQLEFLKQSIQKFGFVEPIVVNKDMTVIGGHQRLKAAQLASIATVPCFLMDLDQDHEKALNLALNRIVGAWDENLLARLVEELVKSAPSVMQYTGFNEREIGNLLDSLIEDSDDEDEVPGLPVEPKTKRGDIWQLGNHRLFCGDSTQLEAIRSFLGEQKIDCVFTDPPYNVNYSGRGKETKNTIQNDNMPPEKFEAFLTEAFLTMAPHLQKTAALYICYASRTHREFENAINAAGFVVHNQIIWAKTLASMGWGDYHWKHEPIFYCSRKEQKANFYGDRTKTTVWRKEPSDKQLLKTIKEMIQKQEKGASTLWTLSRETKYKHPTQKPVALVSIALKNSSQPGDFIFDPFAGSGSTIIASEKLARKCYAVEIDPKYCDCIVARWEKFTNKEATLISA